MGPVFVALLRLLRRVTLQNSIVHLSIRQLLHCFVTLRRFLRLGNAFPRTWRSWKYSGSEESVDGAFISSACTTLCASQLPASIQIPVCPASSLDELSSTDAVEAALDPDTLGSLSQSHGDLVGYQPTSSGPFPDSRPLTLQCLPSNAIGEKVDPPASLDLSTFLKNVVAVAPKESQRYEREAKMDIIREPEYTIDPLTTSFSTSEKTPDSWAPHTHPEGALYFFDATRNVLTDAYLYDTQDLARIEDSISRIFEYMANHQIYLPPQTQLVLEIRRSGKCGYYFADHIHRCIFWLERFDAVDFGIDEVKVNYTSSHVGNEMLSQYWCHNEMFPGILNVPRDAIRELKDTLFHAVGDSLTSQLSTAPFSLEVLQNMMSLVRDIEGQEILDAGVACILYRLMGTFAHERFLNLYGEKVARLNRDQSIHPERKRTYLIAFLSPILLFGPDTHLHNLENMSIDCLINKPSWAFLLQKLTDEWKEFTLYATVLLNANVAFLAIQSVDQGTQNGQRSNTQRASYFSIVTSLGAIILGLLLVRQHNTSDLDMSFLANRSVSSIGLETLALIYSLPYALLMWGMVSFLIAFSLMCCSTSDTITIILLSISWFSLGLLILWSISTSFERRAYYYPWLIRQWKSVKGWQLRALRESTKEKLSYICIPWKRRTSSLSTRSSISQA